MSTRKYLRLADGLVGQKNMFVCVGHLESFHAMHLKCLYFVKL
jgi:hypothetical protein